MVCKYSPGDKQRLICKGVISAFHFSEVRVFDLFSLLKFVRIMHYIQAKNCRPSVFTRKSGRNIIVRAHRKKTSSSLRQRYYPSIIKRCALANGLRTKIKRRPQPHHGQHPMHPDLCPYRCLPPCVAPGQLRCGKEIKVLIVPLSIPLLKSLSVPSSH